MSSLAINEDALRAVSAGTDEDKIYVQLEDGRELYVPLAYFPELLEFSKGELSEVEIVERGRGLFFPKIDEAVSVASLFGATEKDGRRL